jgi:hypothetical protein
MKTMKGRKVSDDTARIVRELRRQGLSLRQIARRAGTSKSTAYRLTKGIPWETAQSRPIETEVVMTGDETERASLRAVTLHVPRENGAAGEERPWIQAAKAARGYCIQRRLTSPLQSPNVAQEQRMPITVQSRDESELDEAEALVRRTPRTAKLYQAVDTINLDNAIRSDDPLRTYGELRRKALAPAVRALLRNKMRSSM